jgi:hypothetical protein
VAIDKRHVGRRYGPYRFEVGLEGVRDFASATGDGVPGRVWAGRSQPGSSNGEAAPAGPSVAPPTYAAVFAIQPFASAISDPELKVNVLRLVHGEQEFEFFEPVRPGDVLDTTGVITRLQERGTLDFIEVTTESHNQHGRLAVRGIWTAIVRN